MIAHPRKPQNLHEEKPAVTPDNGQQLIIVHILERHACQRSTRDDVIYAGLTFDFLGIG